MSETENGSMALPPQNLFVIGCEGLTAWAAIYDHIIVRDEFPGAKRIIIVRGGNAVFDAAISRDQAEHLRALLAPLSSEGQPSPRSRGDFDAGLDLVEFGQRRGGKMQAAGGWVFFAQGLRRLRENLLALLHAGQKRDEQLLGGGKARDQIRQDGVKGVGGVGHESRPQISAVEMFAGYQSWISAGLRTNSLRRP